MIKMIQGLHKRGIVVNRGSLDRIVFRGEKLSLSSLTSLSSVG